MVVHPVQVNLVPHICAISEILLAVYHVIVFNPSLLICYNKKQIRMLFAYEIGYKTAFEPVISLFLEPKAGYLGSLNLIFEKCQVIRRG